MAAEETIISWNPANWITVGLMVAVGYTVLVFITKVYKQRASA